ncbi:MAG: BspA family leucine-rich repeat surface protein, partial [Candidatus Heimdallarchaeota archaeon]|nr:BspA family leucine-rich repeat surface protein [Candidatus Heimdallarchaeota archaeon]
MKKIAIFYCFSLLFLLSASHLMIFQTTGKGETVRDITTTAITADTFVTKWDTTKSGVSLSTQIKLPLESTGTYNFVVDWGDGTTDTITTWDQAQTTHTYSTGGIKDVTFNGILRGWRFNNAGDVSKITGISQWGNMNLGNSGAYFMGASNMVLSATDAPDLTGTTSLYQAFRWCELLGNTGNMNNWDVSAVTDMGWMFLYAMSFNQPLGNWNVSSVTNMANMFMNAFYFNQPIGSWNTSSVTTMSNMFNSATAFNQSVGDWDVSKVTNMNNMFGGATNFNQPLNNWDVSNVIVMNNLLAGTSFNQPLDNWEVSSVTNMQGMFSGLTLFNHSLVNWNVSSVTVMNYMFFGASSFNQPIGDWNTSRVTSMSSMFENAFAFNQPIGSWDVSKVNQMRMMFSGVTSFNQPLDNWNVSSVTNMQGLFKGASLFNQSLGNWNVSKVFTMRDMFSGATSFNQPIGNWNVSSVTTMTGMFSGVTLGVSNYDDLLEGWSKLNLQNNVIFDAGFSRFTNNTAKQYIIDTFSWTITDGGYNDVTPPVISSPEDIFYVVGSIGNQISWNLDDINPNIYNVTHNGGLFTTSTAWTNGAVNVDIDGLSGGIHVFTIFVYDLDFNMATDTVYVTVKSEFITADLSSPSDLTYEFHSFGN